MRADKKRESGFYWVRFEGQVIVAEYTADGLGCSPEGPHWHVPQADNCFLDREVCELLSPRLEPPKSRLVHARDIVVNYDQETVTATCGIRARLADTIFAPLIPSVVNSFVDCELTCVGCRAVLREREKEAQRAETSVRRQTDKSSGVIDV